MRIYLLFTLFFVSFPCFSLSLEEAPLGLTVSNEVPDAFKMEMEKLALNTLLNLVKNSRTQVGDNLFQAMAKVKTYQEDFAVQMKTLIKRMSHEDAWLLEEIRFQTNLKTTCFKKNISYKINCRVFSSYFQS